MARRGPSAEGEPTGDAQGAVKKSGETRKRRVTSTNRLPVADSHIPGKHFITSEVGVVPDMRRSEAEEAFSAAEAYIPLWLQLQELTGKMKPAEGVLRRVTKGVRYFRGVEEDGNFRLTTSLPEPFVWNRDALKRDAGEHYPEVAPKETAIFIVDLDTVQGVDPAVLALALKLVLEYYSVPEEQHAARIHMQVDPEVHEATLRRFIEHNTISLSDEARTFKPGTPKINEPIILREGVETSIASQLEQQE